MKKATVVLSGGQDSVTVLLWAINQGFDINAVTFAYNQKHDIEIGCARMLTHKYNIPHRVIDISFYQSLVDSALTDPTKDISKIDERTKLPASFVPNRNQLFLTIAHSIAILEKSDSILAGMCQTDYSGYPDCRREFINMLERTLATGSGYNIPIITPLMYMTKAETFKFANDIGMLQEVIELSHTCYNGIRSERHDWGYGCGECPACVIRKEGYYKYIQTCTKPRNN